MLGSTDGSVWVFDTGTGLPVGPPLHVSDGIVAEVACATVGGSADAPQLGMAGAPVLVARSSTGGVAVWDLITRERLRELVVPDRQSGARTRDAIVTGPGVSGPAAASGSMACVLIDGVPAAVTTNAVGEVLVHDVRTGDLIRAFATQCRPDVLALACSTIGGPVVVLTDRSGSVLVYDLRTGQPVPEACARYAAPVVTAGAADGSAWAWDLATGDLIGAPRAGAADFTFLMSQALEAQLIAQVTGSSEAAAAAHALEEQANSIRSDGRNETITVLTGARLARHSYAVAGTEDGDIELWDISTGRRAGRLPVPEPSRVQALTAMEIGSRLIVSSGSLDGPCTPGT